MKLSINDDEDVISIKDRESLINKHSSTDDSMKNTNGSVLCGKSFIFGGETKTSVVKSQNELFTEDHHDSLFGHLDSYLGVRSINHPEEFRQTVCHLRTLFSTSALLVSVFVYFVVRNPD